MINEDFLKEQGIDETKHEAIISAYNNAVSKLQDDHKTDKSGAVKSMMEGFEGNIFNVTKIEKNANEKASDYAIRAFDTFHKTNYESKINELTDLNKELDGKIKAGIKDPELAQKIEALEQTLETERKGFQEKETAWESEKAREAKVNKYKSLLPKLKADADQDYKDYKVNGVIEVLVGKDVVDDGKGNLIIKGDESNQFTNTPVIDFLKENLKGIIDEGHQQTGTGQKASGSTVVIDISDSDSPQAKDGKIRDYLKEKGIKVTDKEYSEQFKELRTKYILKK